MAALVAIYKKPADVEAFEKHYFEKHISLAKTMPRFRKYLRGNATWSFMLAARRRAVRIERPAVSSFRRTLGRHSVHPGTTGPREPDQG